MLQRKQKTKQVADFLILFTPVMFFHDHDSYLSKKVRRLFVSHDKNWPKQVELCANNLTLNWNEIDAYLGKVPSDSADEESYFHKIELLWGLIHFVHTKVNLDRIHSPYFNAELLYTWYKQGNHDLLIVLKLTSEFERFLGDAYLLKNTPVPFLLKDLLEKTELDDIFGVVQMRILRLMMGNVKGLNIRNIAWHGFVSKDEIHPSVITMLFILLGSLSQNLQLYLKDNNFQRRKKIKLPKIVCTYEETIGFDELVKYCDRIPQNQKYYWHSSYELYQNGNPLCLVLVLPLFENFLRLIYCHNSKLEESHTKAKLSEHYIILDDILSIEYQGKENPLKNILGNEIEMLLDLFYHPGGPRLRDRISHNEIDLNEISHNLIKFAFYSIFLVLKTIMKIKTNIKYTSQFHVSSILLKSLKDVVFNIKQWKHLPKPECVKNDFTDYDLITRLNEIQLKTLYRPKTEIQSIQKIQLVTNNLIKIHISVQENCESRIKSWENKDMRSRARQNFVTMHNVLPILQTTLFTIIENIIISIVHLENSELDVKFYNLCLKFVENVYIMTKIENNKWAKIEEMCNDFMNKYCNKP